MEGGKVKEGFQIFAATPANDVAIEAAKKYISDNQLTGDDVKLGRIDDSIVVVTKKEVDLIS